MDTQRSFPWTPNRPYRIRNKTRRKAGPEDTETHDRTPDARGSTDTRSHPPRPPTLLPDRLQEGDRLDPPYTCPPAKGGPPPAPGLSVHPRNSVLSLFQAPSRNRPTVVGVRPSTFDPSVSARVKGPNSGFWGDKRHRGDGVTEGDKRGSLGPRPRRLRRPYRKTHLLVGDAHPSNPIHPVRHKHVDAFRPGDFKSGPQASASATGE